MIVRGILSTDFATCQFWFPEEGATIEKQVGENRDQICRLARQSITIVVYDWGDTVFHHGREVRFGERELTC